MDRTDFQSIGNVLRDYIKKSGFESKLKEVRISETWAEIVGRPVSQATKSIQFRNRKMIITLNSSVVRAELSMIKEAIVHRVNELAGEKLIDEIILR
jgi:predicted nucleic acid-binding Zn ribbon protein